MDKRDELIKKLEELINILYDQVALVTGDAFIDQEGYGYKALALSQKITKLESEIIIIKIEIKNG
jgi:flagellar hook-associated protein FlgK